MTRRRDVADGLPYRVYERFGVRVYSVGYMLPTGKWAFRYACPVRDAAEVAKRRAQAIAESARISVVHYDRPPGGFTGLVEAWFQWQEDLPMNDTRKRASSTIAGNKPEAEMLKMAFGHLEPHEITRSMGYAYLVVRSIKTNTYQVTPRSNLFHRNTTGDAFISAMPLRMRSFRSSLDVTRMCRRNVRAILEKAHSIKLSHEPCLGV